LHIINKTHKAQAPVAHAELTFIFTALFTIVCDNDISTLVSNNYLKI
jgi:hypothetical protein